MDVSSTIQESTANRSEPDWLAEQRQQALQQFEASALLRLDHRTILKKFFSLDTLQLQLPPVQPQTTAADGVIVSSLAAAIKDHPQLVKKHFNSTLSSMQKMEALAAAGWNSGVFVYVPQGTEVKLPLETVTAADHSLLQRTLIVLEANSRAKIVDKTEGNPGFRSEIVEIVLGESAELHYANIQNVSKQTVNFSFKHAQLGKDASLTWLEAALGSKLTVSNMTARLEGNGAIAKTLGIIVGDDAQHYDINAVAHHIGTDTTGNMVARGVLKDSSKAVFRGLIQIDNSAARTSSHQTENMLLLSDAAEADAIPELRIDNNDVKCSHAATIGELDEDELFYFASRGINEETARQLIVEGFLTSITNELGIEGLDKSLLQQIMPRIT